MNRPWMPLYVADYLADTAHLSAAQHGAYLLLIMHYWRSGELPDDDRQLAHIARMTVPQWKRARPLIRAFFQDGWKHKRIEFELSEVARISQAGRLAGLASGRIRRERSLNKKDNPKRSFNDRSTTVGQSLNDSGNDRRTISEPLHTSQRKKEDLRDEVQMALRPVRALEDGVWLGAESKQARAWQKYEGKSRPQDKNFGWTYPSEWPPGHEMPKNNIGHKS